MRYSVNIKKCSDIFHEGAINFPNTDKCYIIGKVDGQEFEFYSNSLDQFCTFVNSDFFKQNVFEYEHSELIRFAVTSVWHNGNGNFRQFLSIIEAVDSDQARGIHERINRPNDGGHSLLMMLCHETSKLTII